MLPAFATAPDVGLGGGAVAPGGGAIAAGDAPCVMADALWSAGVPVLPAVGGLLPTLPASGQDVINMMA